jgi:hypothetical protein
LAFKLAKSGLEIEFMSYANMILFPLALLKRFAEKWRLAPQQDSDIAVDVGAFSGLLKGCLVLESRLIPWLRFPFGLSVVAVAKKSSSGGRSLRASDPRNEQEQERKDVSLSYKNKETEHFAIDELPRSKLRGIVSCP